MLHRNTQPEEHNSITVSSFLCSLVFVMNWNAHGVRNDTKQKTDSTADTNNAATNGKETTEDNKEDNTNSVDGSDDVASIKKETGKGFGDGAMNNKVSCLLFADADLFDICHRQRDNVSYLII